MVTSPSQSFEIRIYWEYGSPGNLEARAWNDICTQWERGDPGNPSPPQGLTKEVAYFCWFFLTCLFQRSLHFHSLAPILCTWAIKKTLILFHQLVDEYPHYGFWSSSVNGFKESWIPALPRGWDSTQQKLGPTGGWNVELSICPSVYPSIHLYPSFLSADLSACQPIHLCVFPSICLALHLSAQPSIHHPISVYVSICLSFSPLLFFKICPFPCLSICLSSCGLSIYLAVYHATDHGETTDDDFDPKGIKKNIHRQHLAHTRNETSIHFFSC